MPFELRKILPWLIFLFFILSGLGRQGLFIAFILIIGFLIFRFVNKLKNTNLKSMGTMGTTIDLDKLADRKKAKIVALTLVLGVFLVWLFFASIQIVEAGQTGVYSLFGKVRDDELRSGFHLVIPLAKVTRMSIRTEEYTMSVAQGEGKHTGNDAITSLTKEGLNVDLDMTVLYRLVEEKASDVYRELGLNYDEKVIRPTIRTAIRDIIAQYEAKDIYSERREEVAKRIEDNVRSQLEPRGILVENVLLRNVTLPANLAKAIQEKLQAEQEAQKYDFVLQRENKEKERKVIEAEGQREAQRIINESLTTNYLYYQYINQLKDREGTIYVPTSPTTGMPLFRNVGQ